MDLQAELKKIKSQLENGQIDENEYNKRQKSILDAWVGKPSSNKTTKASNSNIIKSSKDTSPYAVLQLDSNATDAEIRSKYRKLAKNYHPDKNGGIETPEWNKLNKAYEILSDNNKRALYDKYRSVLNESSKLNAYVGGDLWFPYIGNLEIDLWLSSFLENETSPELEIMNQSDEKKRRHDIRISQIVRHLREKLSQFPKQDQSHNEHDSFIKNLYQDASKLSMEPNGKMLLSLLGGIYISKAQDYLHKFSIPTILNIYNKFFNGLGFAANLFSSFAMAKSKILNSEEVNKMAWRLSQSEISSITRETCDNLLKCSHDEKSHLVNSLQLLGKVWIEVGKQ
ncbi:16092_t:CDS:2 [Gigaspora rosea]|nr:16092_t:CDS:2 [Gigaspora rosea]